MHTVTCAFAAATFHRFLWGRYILARYCRIYSYLLHLTVWRFIESNTLIWFSERHQLSRHSGGLPLPRLNTIVTSRSESDGKST